MYIIVYVFGGICDFITEHTYSPGPLLCTAVLKDRRFEGFYHFPARKIMCLVMLGELYSITGLHMMGKLYIIFHVNGLGDLTKTGWCSCPGVHV